MENLHIDQLIDRKKISGDINKVKMFGKFLRVVNFLTLKFFEKQLLKALTNYGNSLIKNW